MERAQVAVQGAGGGVPMLCDLADLSSVRNFAAELQEKAPKLDVLCLNAGMSPSTKATVAGRTKDGFEECVGTNHLGHFLLANLLQPHLAGCGGEGRLVVTASGVHDPEQPGGNVRGEGGATLGDLSGLGALGAAVDGRDATMVDGAIEYDGSKVYKDSKLCNVLFAREAHRRWAEGGIRTRAFNPGFIPASGLFRAPREDNWLAATAFTVIAGLAGFAVPIEVGGARLAYAATASDTEMPAGSYFSSATTGGRGAMPADGFTDGTISKEASDDGKAVSLWELSAALVGCQ
jgi:light-dependent protochlorophyllide reductase